MEDSNFLLALGFESDAEFHKLCANADISTAEKLAAFHEWQYNNGTKDVLLTLQRK